MGDTLGTRIKTMRMSRGMTQTELCEKVGVSRSTVSMWETNEREPDLDTIEALADIFNVPMSALVERRRDAVNPEAPADPGNDIWTLREEERRDPDRKALYMLAKYGTAKDIRQANAIIDALKATNPDFYDGDDPA